MNYTNNISLELDDLDAALNAEMDSQAAIAKRLRKPEPVALEPVEVKPLPTVLGSFDVRAR